MPCILPWPNVHVLIQRGDRTPPEKSQKIWGFLAILVPIPTKPLFNVGPTVASQRNVFSMVYRWRADGGPLIVVFGSFLPSSTKKTTTTITKTQTLAPV